MTRQLAGHGELIEQIKERNAAIERQRRPALSPSVGSLLPSAATHTTGPATATTATTEANTPWTTPLHGMARLAPLTRRSFAAKNRQTAET